MGEVAGRSGKDDRLTIWLLKFVAKHSFNAFVLYRIVIGVLLFGLLGANVLNA